MFRSAALTCPQFRISAITALLLNIEASQRNARSTTLCKNYDSVSIRELESQ